MCAEYIHTGLRYTMTLTALQRYCKYCYSVCFIFVPAFKIKNPVTAYGKRIKLRHLTNLFLLGCSRCLNQQTPTILFAFHKKTIPDLSIRIICNGVRN